MKYLALVSVIILGYLYSINFNDIKSVIEPGNVCPPKTKVPVRPRNTQVSGKMAEAVRQQEDIIAREDQKKADEIDQIARAKLFERNRKPCHEKQDVKLEGGSDLLDKQLREWGWYK